MKVRGQHNSPAALPREITQIPIEKKAGCTTESVWMFWRR